jgi:hypothetical protein
MLHWLRLGKWLWHAYNTRISSESHLHLSQDWSGSVLVATIAWYIGCDQYIFYEVQGYSRATSLTSICAQYILQPCPPHSDSTGTVNSLCSRGSMAKRHGDERKDAKDHRTTPTKAHLQVWPPEYRTASTWLQRSGSVRQRELRQRSRMERTQISRSSRPMPGSQRSCKPQLHST